MFHITAADTVSKMSPPTCACPDQRSSVISFSGRQWPSVTAVDRSFWHECGTPQRRFGRSQVGTRACMRVGSCRGFARLSLGYEPTDVRLRCLGQSLITALTSADLRREVVPGLLYLSRRRSFLTCGCRDLRRLA